jgi:energy-converting hydrogenase Eha subunit H
MRVDLNQCGSGLRASSSGVGSIQSPMKMESGNMLVFDAAIVAVAVFLVTLFTVSRITERREQ